MKVQLNDPPEALPNSETPLVNNQLPNSTVPQSAAPFRLAFSVKEAAEILGVSEKTIRRLINRRLLRRSKALRHLLISKKEIERFLDETTS